ncbi:AAA family ATPase [Arthrobacter sp. ISL-69]|uniref:McrB family protein n=1 Tax=Arthrobacter sp. ISL-69 TaxID=2819113 RepID=UPI001BE60FE6|nr:AAA family ATPase [Arthrobacter sp. ISL-69]MBT2534610.1 AAA family ATPase [Arthrobacter sp. ISL-69]
MDLDAEEYDYKLALAQRLKNTRDAYMAGDSGWFEMLRKDISSSNLMNQYFMMRLVDLGRTRPEDLRKVIDVLWVGEPDVEKIDVFTEQLRPFNPEQFSVGGIVGFASILLLGRDPHIFPPYRARAVKKFLKIVDWEDRGANGTPAERYQLLLDALDEMVRLAPAHDITLRDRLDAQGLLWTVINVDPTDEWSPEQTAGLRQWRGDKELTPEVDLSVPAATCAPALEAVARRIIEAGFRSGLSPIDGATSTWTAENAQDLETRGDLDVGTGTFMAKFERQLKGASRGTILLAAELAYLQVLPLSNVGPVTKVARINKILSWIEDGQVSLPPELREGLETPGAFNGGVGFNIQVAEHMKWLCRLVTYVATQPMSRIDAGLSDPWTFRAITQSVPDDRQTIRYSVDYLAWPGHLPPVVKNDHRIEIWKAFAGIIGGTTGRNVNDGPAIAKDLHGIRLVQQGNTNQFVEWYREPYLSQWRTESEDSGQRAWLVRQSQAGTAMLHPWLEDGFVSTPAQHLGSPAAGSKLNQVQAAVNKGYQHIEYSERKLRATEYHRFLSVMKVDDFVLTAFEDGLYLGVVTGEAHYVEDASSRLRRAVAWQKAPISNEDVPAPLPRLLAEQGSVVDLTEALSIITAWYGSEADPDEETEDAAPTPQIAVVPQLRKATPELARKLNVGQEHLQEVIRLLQTRQQIVFYGPPGTGKTYLGTAIAKFLAGEEHADHVKTVQFHPSYAYEDFFEGYRPAKSQDGNVGFSLEAGPLRRIADEAASEGNRDKPYFLIIDEMNRGNLAKIFGELYYLLEYRNEGINLQYNPEKIFALPPNLFIIGTMNTSDRSIAMVDAAIRRRFAFVELHPQEGMISGLLERFLTANGKPSLRADLLNALNNEIEDTNRDLMIGPSYFMKPHAGTDQGLEEIWKYELLPLLEEQYFGRLKRNQVREKFGLAAMRRKAASAVGPVDPSPESAEQVLDADGAELLEQLLTDSEDTST